MKSIQLILLTILRYSFFIVTYPLNWLVLIIDILLYLLTFKRFESNMTENLTSFCISVNKFLLKKEFNVIFKK